MAALPAFSTFSTKAGFAAEHITEVLLVGGGRGGRVSDRESWNARNARRRPRRRSASCGALCIRGIARARHARDRSTVRRARKTTRRTERNARQTRRTACFVCASAESDPRVGLAPAKTARRRSRSARVGAAEHRSRLIGKNVRGVSRRERGRTACWCVRRRAARRGRWWRRGKPSLRCLSCVEGEACADMKPPERAMGGRAFGKTRERSQLDSLPDFGRFPTL
jgi:hypothetical protein